MTRLRGTNRMQSRAIGQIKNLTAIIGRLPADPPNLSRQIENDMVLDWSVAFGTSTSVTPPTYRGPGRITTTGGGFIFNTDTITNGVISRYGFEPANSAIAAAWRTALDSVAIVKACAWGPFKTDSNIEGITLELPFHGPGYAVSGNSQAATAYDACGKATRARCSLTPPVLNWWDPRFATGTTAYTVLQFFAQPYSPTAVPVDSEYGYVRITIRMKMGVANVAGRGYLSGVTAEAESMELTTPSTGEPAVEGPITNLAGRLQQQFLNAGVQAVGVGLSAAIKPSSGTLRRAGHTNTF
jgi:hypothetical protein